MHEYYFSLYTQCRNTHFILNEERSIHRDTNPLSLSYSLIYQGDASPFKGSSHTWMQWCVLFLTPSHSIYRLGHQRENTLCAPSMQPGANREPTCGRPGLTDLRSVRLMLGSCHTRFSKKTECISYVCQNHKFTHMIDKLV
jgi:hypothetical protein